MKLPEKKPDCKEWRAIDKRMLFHLKGLEIYNDAKLEAFWKMNCESKVKGEGSKGEQTQ